MGIARIMGYKPCPYVKECQGKTQRKTEDGMVEQDCATCAEYKANSFKENPGQPPRKDKR